MLGSGSVTTAVEAAGSVLSSYDGVDLVTIMMIQLRPESDDWEPLGDRAHLRYWRRPGSPCVPDLPPKNGVKRSLSLPWISPLARVRPVAVHDTFAMPPEAVRDRDELAECHGRAIVCRSITRNGQLFGSVAISRETPGMWPANYIADVELFSSALASLMSEARATTAAAAALERADQAADTQQQFFSAIGHELRTPIAAILGSAEMIEMEAEGREDGFAETVARDARVVLKAGEQLLAIVEDLLGTGRALGEATARRPVDAAEAVDDVLHWMRATAAPANVTLVSEVPPDLRTISTPVALRQVLTNLIGNAITHGGPGTTVRVTASRVVDEYRRPRIHIRVTDDGPGLTPQQQQEVFKPFVRFARVGADGTGLGLSLSRSLAERDGGLLGVESTPGQGATFWIDLPAAEER